MRPRVVLADDHVMVAEGLADWSAKSPTSLRRLPTASNSWKPSSG